MKEQEAAEVAPAPPEEPEELDRDALAAEYERVFGKEPHGRMKPETIAARIAEHADDPE